MYVYFQLIVFLSQLLLLRRKIFGSPDDRNTDKSYYSDFYNSKFDFDTKFRLDLGAREFIGTNIFKYLFRNCE